MAELLAKGLDALPPQAGMAILIASAVGIAIPLLRKVESIKDWVPSGLAMGIAFRIPYLCAGHVLRNGWFIWKRRNPTAVEKFNFALASGLVAGEGLMGIVNAVLTILGVESIT